MFPKSKLIALCCVFLLLVPTHTTAAPRNISVQWEQLETLVLGERVTIKLSDATVTGAVIAVTDNTILLDVVKSTNPNARPPGPNDIPRTAFTSLELGRQGKVFRWLSLPLGIAAGIGISKALDKNISNHTTNLILGSAIGIGLGFGISALARKLDRKVTVITIQK